MKTRKNELDVDFIGGAQPLTKEEEKKISDFIKSRKTNQKSAAKSRQRKLTTRKPIIV
jgi:hypothetical protein